MTQAQVDPRAEFVEEREEGEIGNQAEPTEHFLFDETSCRPRLLLHTTEKFPGNAYLHIDGKGFGLCVLLTPEECREIGNGFLEAADVAEKNAR